MPTALIPFCAFNNNMNITGKKIKQFDVPVCNIFKPKIVKDQLCYTVNPNDFRDKTLSQELSFSFAVDHNEERISDGILIPKPFVRLDDFDKKEELVDNFVIIETIGKEEDFI